MFPFATSEVSALMPPPDPRAPLFAAIIVIFTAGHLPHPPLSSHVGSKPVFLGSKPGLQTYKAPAKGRQAGRWR